MSFPANIFSKNTPLLQRFFLLAAVGGLICIGLLLSLPKDPDSGVLLGYSLTRLILFTAAATPFLFSLWLTNKSRRDSAWHDDWLQKFSAFLQRGNNPQRLLGFLLVLISLGIWFLLSTYTRSEFRLRPDLLLLLETIKTNMLRLAPFVIWGIGLGLQTIWLIHQLGFGTKENYAKAISKISFFIVPFILLTIFIIDRIDDRYYKWITREDDLVEDLTVLCLVLAAAISLIKGIQIKNPKDLRYWFFILFTVACVLFALEEISWGQRIFNVESPEFFMENSDQQEINIHNTLQKWFNFRTKHVAAVVLFLYGTVLPLLAFIPRVKNLVLKTGVSIPPLVLSLGFLLSSVLMIDLFFSGREEEVGELCMAACLFFFMAIEYFQPLKANSESG